MTVLLVCKAEGALHSIAVSTAITEAKAFCPTSGILFVQLGYDAIYVVTITDPSMVSFGGFRLCRPCLFYAMCGLQCLSTRGYMSLTAIGCRGFIIALPGEPVGREIYRSRMCQNGLSVTENWVVQELRSLWRASSSSVGHSVAKIVAKDLDKGEHG